MSNEEGTNDWSVSADAFPVPPLADESDEQLLSAQNSADGNKPSDALTPISGTSAEDSQTQIPTDKSTGHTTSMVNPGSVSGSDEDSEQKEDDIVPLIRSPHPDWKFNIFLHNIEEEMTDEEFRKVKGLFEGEGGIPARLLDKMKTPKDLFRILRTSGFLDRNNLMFLQSALFWIGRKDLVKEAVEYARKNKDVLHIYSPTYQPENGYKYVKFHLAGRDFTKFGKEQLEYLRRQVIDILQVPENYVIVADLKPSASVVVTFMIPEMYAEIFSELLQSKTEMNELHEAGVDTVVIGEDEVYYIKETKVKEPETIKTRTYVADLCQKLRECQGLLEDTQTRYLEVCQQLDDCQAALKNTVENMKRTELKYELLKKALRSVEDGKTPAPLELTTALQVFSSTLEKISQEFADKNVILQAIDSVIVIIGTRIREANRLQNQALLLKINELQSQLLQLVFDNKRYKFCLAGAKITCETKVTGGRLEAQIGATSLQLSEMCINITREISKELTEEEKDKMKENYTWTQDGVIENFMAEDPSNFMACIFHKELEKKKHVIDFESFIFARLSEVGRDDLRKFVESRTSEYQHQQQEQRQQRAHNIQFSQSFRAEAAVRIGIDLDEGELIKKISFQVGEMYKLITSKDTMFHTKLEDTNIPLFTPHIKESKVTVKTGSN